jgi:hypothetical protein
VILENGEKSSLFDLLKGTAQGDCPSPIIYNICAQVIIFKIELDDRISSITPGRQMPSAAPDPDPDPVPNDFMYESNYEMSKNESFADDSTIIMDNFVLQGINVSKDKIYAPPPRRWSWTF